MNLYRLAFNWQGELIHLHTHAKSRSQAFRNGVVHLSEKLGFSEGKIRAYFKMCKRKNFEIVLLKKYTPKKYKEKEVKIEYCNESLKKENKNERMDINK